MDCPKIYNKTVIINSRDVDGTGQCKASALLGYLQDASAEHTAVCGCGRKEMVERYNVFWMLTRIQVELVRPIHWLDQLTIRTGHRGGKGILLYRDYELLVDGREVGYACALWVLSDLNTRKLLNVSQTPIPQLSDFAGGLEPKIRKLTALHPPKDMTLAEVRTMRYSDTDVNGHVNNVRYVDFLCDALHMERLGPSRFVSSLQVGYLAECMAGETIELYTGQAGGLWYVHGADQAGKSRFDSAVELAELTP